MLITSLQPAISTDLAQRKLARLGGWWTGRLRGFASVYLPYRLYQVRIQDRGHEQARFTAVDAAAGTLDPYEFPATSGTECWREVETRNCHPVKLNERDTRELAIQSVRRLLFSRGFFRIGYAQFTAELVQPEFYIPYWVGFYGDERNLRIKLLNGINHAIEGNRLRRVVRAWLMEQLSSAPALVSAVERNS